MSERSCKEVYEKETTYEKEAKKGRGKESQAEKNSMGKHLEESLAYSDDSKLFSKPEIQNK